LLSPEASDVKCIAIDFDGTLFQSVWPDRGIGKPIFSAFCKLEEVIQEGWEPVIYTARSWTDYEAIKAAMEDQGYYDIRIICGKLLAVKYVDDRALVAEAISWMP
jgi:hypothetical protein